MSAANTGRLINILYHQMPTTLNSYREIFEELRETNVELSSHSPKIQDRKERRELVNQIASAMFQRLEKRGGVGHDEKLKLMAKAARAGKPYSDLLVETVARREKQAATLI